MEEPCTITLPVKSLDTPCPLFEDKYWYKRCGFIWQRKTFESLVKICCILKKKNKYVSFNYCYVVCTIAMLPAKTETILCSTFLGGALKKKAAARAKATPVWGCGHRAQVVGWGGVWYWCPLWPHKRLLSSNASELGHDWCTSAMCRGTQEVLFIPHSAELRSPWPSLLWLYQALAGGAQSCQGCRFYHNWLPRRWGKGLVALGQNLFKPKQNQAHFKLVLKRNQSVFTILLSKVITWVLP